MLTEDPPSQHARVVPGTRAGGGGPGAPKPALPVWAAPSGVLGGTTMPAAGQAGDPEPGVAPLPSRPAQLLSALFYASCSFLLVLVNKALLTAYG